MPENTAHNRVKVSVLMLTYNHEPFIAKAIEGVLNQETDFPWELVITEDCSTDATRSVIHRYWQRYPDRIRVFLNRRNVGALKTNLRGYQYCRGQYVAALDGDDYWVRPNKLQRQADLLDAHPEYALCFHCIRMAWEDESREEMVFRPRPLKDCYTLEDLLEYNFIGACSPMYRKGLFDSYPNWFFVMPVGDWAVHVLHALHGDIGYIDEPMGVYRQHDQSMYSATDVTGKIELAIEMLRRFRCGMGKNYRRVLSRSLCRQYDKLVRQYDDEGKVPEARQSACKGLLDVGFDGDSPWCDMFKILCRLIAPGCRRPRNMVLGNRSA